MKPIAYLSIFFWSLSSLPLFAQQLDTQTELATQSESQTQDAEAQVNNELTPEQEEYVKWAKELWDGIEQHTGEVQLAGNVATLNVPDTFYYLNSQDSKKVLMEVWGNPPSQSENVLGMLFPANVTPFEGSSWGVTIEYVEDGYVSDEDADSIDYNELLQQMKEDTASESENRVEQGYESIELVGWAAPPYYDKASNKLHWAKEIKFGAIEVNTLNYNIRVLGRKGVLVLNFIAGINQLETVNQNLDTVMNIADFNEGSRYQDFDPEIDDVAAYGIGALVAGKVLTKTGILAALFMFLKKFGVAIVIALGVFVRKLFGRKKTQAAESD